MGERILANVVGVCGYDADGLDFDNPVSERTSRLCTITASEEVMLLTLKARFVGNVYVIECVGRIVRRG
jgi:hypothetical protein